MGTVRYTVINGEVVAEKRGGVRRLYVPDPLGSTVALLDNTQAKTDTFSYWPYGEESARTGTTPTPFRFLGTKRFYRDSAARFYQDDRVMDALRGKWATADLTTRRNNSYSFASDRPLTSSAVFDPFRGCVLRCLYAGGDLMNCYFFCNLIVNLRKAYENLCWYYCSPGKKCYDPVLGVFQIGCNYSNCTLLKNSLKKCPQNIDLFVPPYPGWSAECLGGIFPNLGTLL